MKKLFYFIIGIIIVICTFYIIYTNYRIEYSDAKKQNLFYEYYYQKEVNGLELATIINKSIDNNEKNEVTKDENNMYVSNNENSINIDIHITDNDTIYKMETLYNNDINKFIKNYKNIKFKCMEVKYHKNTNKVCYLYFEQISD